MTEDAKKLLQALKEKELLDLRMKELNKYIYILEQKLNESMQSLNSDKISIDGIEFKPVIEESYAINKIDGLVENWNDPTVFDWFRERNMGDLIMNREEIHHTQRTASLKEYVKEGNPLPDFIKQTLRETVKYNKSAVKRLVKESLPVG